MSLQPKIFTFWNLWVARTQGFSSSILKFALHYDFYNLNFTFEHLTMQRMMHVSAVYMYTSRNGDLKAVLF